MNIPIAYSIKTLGLPIIPVKLFDAPVSSLFLIDTGSDQSIMDIALYEHFKDKIPSLKQGKDIITANGKTETALTAIFDFTIDETLRFSEPFTCMDCSVGFNQIEKETGYQLHGILGMAFLVKHRWKIDFEKLLIQS